MQKILPIFLALFATLTVVGILVLVTRTGSSWPSSIRALDWKRLTGATPEEEPAPTEAPAE
jgi:hypothetical protein